MAITLTDYLNRTKLQLQNPAGAASKLFTDTDLTTYINLARSQLSGEGECIRNFATLPAPTGTRTLNFSSIVLAVPTAGILDVFNVRQTLVQLGGGLLILTVRPFPWFVQYHMNKIVPTPALPTDWSQYGQGIGGSIYLDPVPDQDYVLNVDCVCQPVDLVDDTTVEAIPYPWTDVVPFYAAWYALTSANRQTDADKMMERVQLYMSKARTISTSEVVPGSFLQAPADPSLQNKFGLKQGRQGGGQ